MLYHLYIIHILYVMGSIYAEVMAVIMVSYILGEVCV